MQLPSRAKKALKPEVALMRLEALCARSEQCEGEIRRKLRLWQIGEEDADTIVRSLRRRRFVDDSRYAGAFVRDKYRFARWGRRKIELALRQKRVDADIIAEALEEIDEDEYTEVLRQLIVLKSRLLGSADTYDARSRLFRFAVLRGFESTIVSKIISQVLK